MNLHRYRGSGVPGRILITIRSRVANTCPNRNRYLLSSQPSGSGPVTKRMKRRLCDRTRDSAKTSRKPSSKNPHLGSATVFPVSFIPFFLCRLRAFACDFGVTRYKARLPVRTVLTFSRKPLNPVSA